MAEEVLRASLKSGTQEVGPEGGQDLEQTEAGGHSQSKSMHTKNRSATLSPMCGKGTSAPQGMREAALAHPDSGGQRLVGGTDVASELQLHSFQGGGGCSLPPSFSLITPRDSAIIFCSGAHIRFLSESR